jgi:polysaccharide biosynthesis protein PelE
VLSDREIFMLLAAHGVISLLAGWLSVTFMPSQYRSSPRRTVAYHFLIAWFIPVLGAVMVLLVASYARIINRRYSERNYHAVRLPVFTAAPRDPALAYGAGSIYSRLTNPDLPKEVRLKALLTVQAMPGNLSTQLLREVLSDPSDDLRLTAYGMLDKGEKRLNQLIQQNLRLLEDNAEADHEGQISKQIASCYWEMVYQGYAQGELRNFSLNAAWRHAQVARQRRSGDADLWMLIGRIALERRDSGQAAQAFTSAQKLAVPAGRVRPYLAELAFMHRDFATVRKLIRDIDRHECGLSTAPLQAFWRSEGRI